MTISKKIKTSFFVVLSIAFVSAVISFLFYKTSVNGSQRTFIFPSVEDGKMIIERRNLPKSYISDVEYYVNEILLGPQTERTERLFSKDTELLSCFQRGKILYVNLSKGILNTSGKMLPIKESIELFEKNILNNYKSISKVEVYVEGNLAYSE